MKMEKVLTLEQLRTLKNRLRVMDQAWVESKTKMGGGGGTQNYISVDTAIQILEYATYGITTWDYVVHEQFQTEAHKKNNGQFAFDGAIANVRASLTIHGLGTRTQYGRDVLTGGANQQAKAYQAATSNALSKCASMFGVGEKLYVDSQKQIFVDFAHNETVNNAELLADYERTSIGIGMGIRSSGVVDLESEEEIARAFNMPSPSQVQQPQEQVQQPQQPQQQPQQQGSFGPPQGTSQQDNFAQPNNQQQNGFQAQTFDEQFMPNNFNQMPDNEQVQTQGNMWNPPTQQDEQFMNNNSVPFGAPQTPPQTSQDNAPINVNQAMHQGGAEIQTNMQATQVQQPTNEVPTGSNEQQQFVAQINIYNQQKARIGAKSDDDMLMYMRDYFKDENATTQNLNMETIVGFNAYLENIQV